MPDDWAGGTRHLTRLQRGAYFDILMEQVHENESDGLTLEQIRDILGEDFGACWPLIQRKFVCDDDVHYYNRKMSTEISRAIYYSQSRSHNRRNKKQLRKKHMNIICNSYEHHMGSGSGSYSSSLDLSSTLEDSKIPICKDGKAEHPLIAYWLSKEHVVRHRVITGAMRKAAVEVCKVLPIDSLKAAIDAYDDIMGKKPGTYYGQYPHSFDAFFRPGMKKAPPYQKFLPEANPLERLLVHDKDTYTGPTTGLDFGRGR